MKRSAVTATFMVRVHEERPDIAIDCVAYCEGDDFSVRLDYPTAT
jgi:hypothetical protein